MTERLQKTIIAKFVQLENQPVVTENELVTLANVIEKLYVERKLIQSDFYRQKIELITTILNKAIEEVKRKRTKKEISLKVPKEFTKILLEDLDNVDYSKSDLMLLDAYESNEPIQISPENIEKVLSHLVVVKRRLTSEVDFEKFISDQLAQVYGKDQIHRQYSVGGFLALKTDIDIGNGQVGIELKVADKLTASEMQRLVGQVLYYKKRFYNDNLLVLIGSKTPINSTLKELKEFIEELEVTVVFVQAINW